MDLESDLKKVSLINRNKFAGLEKAQGKSRDLSQPQQPKHFRVLRQKASSLQKIISTAPHRKPRRFLNDPKPPITPLKKPIGYKVRSVLKNSGNSLLDRH